MITMQNIPYLAPQITLPTNPQGTYTFPFGPEWRSYPQAGLPLMGMKPPPPLFGARGNEKADPIFQKVQELNPYKSLYPFAGYGQIVDVTLETPESRAVKTFTIITALVTVAVMLWKSL